MSDTKSEVVLSLEQYNVLLDNVRGMREEIARIDRDLASDRRDIDDLKINQASHTQSLKSIIDMLERYQIKTKDAIRDAVSDVVDPVQDTLDRFVAGPRTLLVNPEKGIWQRIFGRKRKKGVK
jgi:hypothetical protein